ncbi:MAG: ArsA family ATPase [Oligoflexia bacterium]|nr:ArsA family ATPase [Oligoflexia bacterium]
MTPPRTLPFTPSDQLRGRKLLFVSGKGGVGKTAVSQALALARAREGKRVLWVTFEDPLRPAGELRQVPGPKGLWQLNCDATRAFEEYAALKIGMAPLTRVFLRNKLMQYLAKAAPGIHELVLLGKVWHERLNYDQVIVDMPSTGYGLAMFQSTENFRTLFKGGPLFRDAEQMLRTFSDPAQTGLLIVALPEEMPLQESLELHEFLLALFPENPSGFIVNRLFPRVTGPAEEQASPPDSWPTPHATSVGEYLRKRSILESANLRIWSGAGLEYAALPYVPPAPGQSFDTLVEALSQELSR